MIFPNMSACEYMHTPDSPYWELKHHVNNDSQVLCRRVQSLNVIPGCPSSLPSHAFPPHLLLSLSPLFPPEAASTLWCRVSLFLWTSLPF